MCLPNTPGPFGDVVDDCGFFSAGAFVCMIGQKKKGTKESVHIKRKVCTQYKDLQVGYDASGRLKVLHCRTREAWAVSVSV